MFFSQFAYEIQITRWPEIQTVLMNTPLNPKALMGAVNQSGKLKIHAVVDTRTEKTKHEFLVIGSGRAISEDLIPRLVRLDTLIFNDGRHGYTIYYLMPEVDLDKSEADTAYKPVSSECLSGADSAHGEALITVTVKNDECSQTSSVIATLIANMKKKSGIFKVVYDGGEKVYIHVNKMLWEYPNMRKSLSMEIMGYACVSDVSL